VALNCVLIFTDDHLSHFTLANDFGLAHL